LKRREEGVVPNCPSPLTTTALPATADVATPARKAFVWLLPMRIVFDSSPA
jgi:hypothetical protein